MNIQLMEKEHAAAREYIETLGHIKGPKVANLVLAHLTMCLQFRGLMQITINIASNDSGNTTDKMKFLGKDLGQRHQHYMQATINALGTALRMDGKREPEVEEIVKGVARYIDKMNEAFNS